MRNRHASGLAAPILPVPGAGYIASASSPMRSTNKVVFAITSNGNDYYTAMTRVAVASLRLSNPAVRVLVSCDRETDRSVHQVSDPLIEEVDEWLAVDTPAGDSGFRNRFVKTSLRELISGPYLFLDSDVFVRGDLSEIFHLDTDIAGARNHSREALSEQIWDQDYAMLEAMEWTIRTDVYINGGVLFWNDTASTRRFGAEWHRRWLRSFSSKGNYRDQPALNSAIDAIQPRLIVLPDRYNAQVKTNTFVARDADIWHFYSDSHLPGFFQYDVVVRKLLKNRHLDVSQIRELRRHREPWRDEMFGDRYVGNRVARQGYAGGWEITWLSGSRLKGLLSCIRGFRDRR